MVPLLSLLVLFVVWAGRTGNTSLGLELAAEEAAVAGAMAAGACADSRQDDEPDAAAVAECVADADAVVALALESHAATWACLGGARGAAAPSAGDTPRFVEIDEASGAAMVRVECDSDVAVAPLQGLFPVVPLSAEALHVPARGFAQTAVATATEPDPPVTEPDPPVTEPDPPVTEPDPPVKPDPPTDPTVQWAANCDRDKPKGSIWFCQVAINDKGGYAASFGSRMRLAGRGSSPAQIASACGSGIDLVQLRQGVGHPVYTYTGEGSTSLRTFFAACSSASSGRAFEWQLQMWDDGGQVWRVVSTRPASIG